jgi:hypothetical protein
MKNAHKHSMRDSVPSALDRALPLTERPLESATNFKKESLSSEANSCSASQEIPSPL